MILTGLRLKYIFLRNEVHFMKSYDEIEAKVRDETLL